LARQQQPVEQVLVRLLLGAVRQGQLKQLVGQVLVRLLLGVVGQGQQEQPVEQASVPQKLV
jgi:hypothetical protein